MINRNDKIRNLSVLVVLEFEGLPILTTLRKLRGQAGVSGKGVDKGRSVPGPPLFCRADEQASDSDRESSSGSSASASSSGPSSDGPEATDAEDDDDSQAPGEKIVLVSLHPLLLSWTCFQKLVRCAALQGP